MPQINQLADVLYSQLFWLLLTLAIIYFGVGRAMVPRIQSVMADRDKRIADDLAAAEAARGQADEAEEAWRARIDAGRAQALKLTAEAKQASALATEKKVAAADEKLRGKLEAAEAKLRKARDAALADIEKVAAEAARQMAARLAGIEVAKAEASKAVKEAMADG
ncbi:MAG: F0F1 ATP synthase subunit B family protein [Sphingosinicella sp.]